MNVDVLDLPIPIDGRHLPECPHRDERSVSPDGPCDWCLWAIRTPELTTLMAIGRDTQALLHSDAVDSVAGIVAFARLVEMYDAVELDSVWVASARRLVEVTRRTVAANLGRLRVRIDHAVAADGPVETRCLRTAGALTVVALQSDPSRIDQVALPGALRRDIERLTSGLSATVQLATLLPLIEQMHHHDLPTLLTQPEWSRRPSAGSRHNIVARQLAGAALEPGSLEALVVETAIQENTELLLSLGERLADLGPRFTVSRATIEQPHAGRTRELVWRVSRLDWHLTFVDTALAACWDARVDGGFCQTDVPWVVALAIDASLGAGLVSGLFATVPSRLEPTT